MSTYMLLFRDAPAAVYDAMTPAERTASLDKWNAWYDTIADRGVMVSAHPLESAVRIVSGPGGKSVSTDPSPKQKS